MKYKTIEKIPTWSLCYLINGDPTGLTEDEIREIDEWMGKWQVEIVAPIEGDNEIQPYFTYFPLFGLATDVVDCIIYHNNLI